MGSNDQWEKEGNVLIVHASSVAVAGRGLLIVGSSGRGKSALALEMMARGATLIADDRTCLQPDGEGRLLAFAPNRIAGRIEARGVGILDAAHCRAPVAAVVDLDLPERERLPPMRYRALAGVTLALLHNPEMPHFPAALIQYLKGASCPT